MPCNISTRVINVLRLSVPYKSKQCLAIYNPLFPTLSQTLFCYPVFFFTCKIVRITDLFRNPSCLVKVKIEGTISEMRKKICDVDKYYKNNHLFLINHGEHMFLHGK